MSETQFSREKFEAPYPDGIEHHYWSIARHRIIFRQLRKIARPQSDLILDVGCGRGLAVQWLRDRGMDAMGCDLGNPEPANAGIAPYLYLGMAAESLPAELASRVRVILLLDVLEHLDNPATFLANLLRHFTNCRDVLMTVPARQELWSNYDEYYGHKLRYDLPAVARLAQEANCDLHNAGYFFHSLWLPARVMHAMGKNRSIQIHPPTGTMRPLHRMIASGFVLERHILPKRWAGTSIIAVLRRRS
jgi:SAM-dependent methyltransferase